MKQMVFLSFFYTMCMSVQGSCSAYFILKIRNKTEKIPPTQPPYLDPTCDKCFSEAAQLQRAGAQGAGENTRATGHRQATTMVKVAKGVSKQKYHLGSSPRCYEHVPSDDKVSERTPELNFLGSFPFRFCFFVEFDFQIWTVLLYISCSSISRGLHGTTLLLQQYLNTSWIVVVFGIVYVLFCVFEYSGLSVSCLVCGRFNPSLQARWSSPSRLLSSSPITRTSLASTM